MTITPGPDETGSARLSRRQWQARLDGPWPAEHSRSRVLRGTLRSLAGLMTADGVLSQERDKLAARVGMPRRTLEYHLARAVELGWLVHLAAGRRRVGYGCYAAADPGSQHAKPCALETSPQRASYERARNGATARQTLRASLLTTGTTEQGGRDESRTRQGVPTTDPGRRPRSGSPGRASREREMTSQRSSSPRDNGQSTGLRPRPTRREDGHALPGTAAQPTTEPGSPGDHDNGRNAAHDRTADVVASRGDLTSARERRKSA